MIRAILDFWDELGCLVPRWVILLAILNFLAFVYIIGHFVRKYW